MQGPASFRHCLFSAAFVRFAYDFSLPIFGLHRCVLPTPLCISLRFFPLLSEEAGGDLRANMEMLVRLLLGLAAALILPLSRGYTYEQDGTLSAGSGVIHFAVESIIRKKRFFVNSVR